MKWFAKCMMAAVVLFAAYGAQAQTMADAGNINPGAATEVKAPSPVTAKELTVTIKNDCEKHITIFAGSKKEVFAGKDQMLGGISTNTLYIKEGDVVCIMNDPKTIQACTIAKDGLSKVEINKSGNGFVK
jgi:hypothetical protein